VTVVSAALAVGIGLVCGLYLRQLAKALEMPAHRLVLACAPAVIGVAVMTAVLLAARRLLSGAPVAVELALLVAIGAVVYGGVIAVTARKRLIEDARTFARAQADSPPQAAGVVGEAAASPA
jgi:hypothetical protein